MTTCAQRTPSCEPCCVPALSRCWNGIWCIVGLADIFQQLKDLCALIAPDNNSSDNDEPCDFTSIGAIHPKIVLLLKDCSIRILGLEAAYKLLQQHNVQLQQRLSKFAPESSSENAPAVPALLDAAAEQLHSRLDSAIQVGTPLVDHDIATESGPNEDELRSLVEDSGTNALASEASMYEAHHPNAAQSSAPDEDTTMVTGPVESSPNNHQLPPVRTQPQAAAQSPGYSSPQNTSQQSPTQDSSIATGDTPMEIDGDLANGQTAKRPPPIPTALPAETPASSSSLTTTQPPSGTSTAAQLANDVSVRTSGSIKRPRAEDGDEPNERASARLCEPPRAVSTLKPATLKPPLASYTSRSTTSSGPPRAGKSTSLRPVSSAVPATPATSHPSTSKQTASKSSPASAQSVCGCGAGPVTLTPAQREVIGALPDPERGRKWLKAMFVADKDGFIQQKAVWTMFLADCHLDTGTQPNGNKPQPRAFFDLIKDPSLFPDAKFTKSKEDPTIFVVGGLRRRLAQPCTCPASGNVKPAKSL
ncbi:hypothetical protein BKA62DRAFT_696687 [Auriculariales sp. MPI-PUGE-AT-0066]|nr:hypothetical protein BKA62DRAFT_696687 [Auriculariales sp. MPI-PUGE-AT-0066]